MRRYVVGAFGLLALGCGPLTRFEDDPHAVAPEYGRWEVAVPVPADSAYATLLTVALETGYTVATASRTDRLVTTHVRDVRVGHGLTATDWYVRFTLAALPLGADSSRISVTGDRCGARLSACEQITAGRDGGPKGTWQLVRWLGEETFARLTAERVSLH